MLRAPEITRYSDNIQFRLGQYEAKKATKVKVKNWFKDLGKDVFVYREQGNHWGKKQDYYDYTISFRNLSM